MVSIYWTILSLFFFFLQKRCVFSGVSLPIVELHSGHHVNWTEDRFLVRTVVTCHVDCRLHTLTLKHAGP